MGEPVTLYHTTSRAKLPSILEEGVRPGSYWGTAEIADYAETVEDEEAGILALRLEDLDAGVLAPDLAGVEEPITTVVGLREEEVWRRWAETDGGWAASLDLVGSLCVTPAIAPGLFWLDENLDDHPSF